MVMYRDADGNPLTVQPKSTGPAPTAIGKPLPTFKDADGNPLPNQPKSTGSSSNTAVGPPSAKATVPAGYKDKGDNTRTMRTDQKASVGRQTTPPKDKGDNTRMPKAATTTTAKKAGGTSAFGSAFASARKAGKDTFTFNGKSYNTKRADGKALPGKKAATAPSGGYSPPAPAKKAAAKASVGRQNQPVKKQAGAQSTPKFTQSDPQGSTSGSRTRSSRYSYMEREK
jgi:hypothetical protein